MHLQCVGKFRISWRNLQDVPLRLVEFLRDFVVNSRRKHRWIFLTENQTQIFEKKAQEKNKTHSKTIFLRKFSSRSHSAATCSRGRRTFCRAISAENIFLTQQFLRRFRTSSLWRLGNILIVFSYCFFHCSIFMSTTEIIFEKKKQFYCRGNWG